VMGLLLRGASRSWQGLRSWDGANFQFRLYLVTGKSPDKGYLVFVNPPG
jgi:hypothetical protein